MLEHNQSSTINGAYLIPIMKAAAFVCVITAVATAILLVKTQPWANFSRFVSYGGYQLIGPLGIMGTLGIATLAVTTVIYFRRKKQTKIDPDIKQSQMPIPPGGNQNKASPKDSLQPHAPPLSSIFYEDEVQRPSREDDHQGVLPLFTDHTFRNDLGEIKPTRTEIEFTPRQNADVLTLLQTPKPVIRTPVNPFIRTPFASHKELSTEHVKVQNKESPTDQLPLEIGQDSDNNSLFSVGHSDPAHEIPSGDHPNEVDANLVELPPSINFNNDPSESQRVIKEILSELIEEIPDRKTAISEPARPGPSTIPSEDKSLDETANDLHRSQNLRGLQVLAEAATPIKPLNERQITVEEGSVPYEILQREQIVPLDINENQEPSPVKTEAAEEKKPNLAPDKLEEKDIVYRDQLIELKKVADGLFEQLKDVVPSLPKIVELIPDENVQKEFKQYFDKYKTGIKDLQIPNLDIFVTSEQYRTELIGKLAIISKNLKQFQIPSYVSFLTDAYTSLIKQFDDLRNDLQQLKYVNKENYLQFLQHCQTKITEGLKKLSDLIREAEWETLQDGLNDLDEKLKSIGKIKKAQRLDDFKAYIRDTYIPKLQSIFKSERFKKAIIDADFQNHAKNVINALVCISKIDAESDYLEALQKEIDSVSSGLQTILEKFKEFNLNIGDQLNKLKKKVGQKVKWEEDRSLANHSLTILNNFTDEKLQKVIQNPEQFKVYKETIEELKEIFKNISQGKATLDASSEEISAKLITFPIIESKLYEEINGCRGDLVQKYDRTCASKLNQCKRDRPELIAATNKKLISVTPSKANETDVDKTLKLGIVKTQEEAADYLAKNFTLILNTLLEIDKLKFCGETEYLAAVTNKADEARKVIHEMQSKIDMYSGTITCQLIFSKLAGAMHFPHEGEVSDTIEVCQRAFSCIIFVLTTALMLKEADQIRNVLKKVKNEHEKKFNNYKKTKDYKSKSPKDQEAFALDFEKQAFNQQIIAFKDALLANNTYLKEPQFKKVFSQVLDVMFKEQNAETFFSNPLIQFLMEQINIDAKTAEVDFKRPTEGYIQEEVHKVLIKVQKEWAQKLEKFIASHTADESTDLMNKIFEAKIEAAKNEIIADSNYLTIEEINEYIPSIVEGIFSDQRRKIRDGKVEAQVFKSEEEKELFKKYLLALTIKEVENKRKNMPAKVDQPLITDDKLKRTYFDISKNQAIWCGSADFIAHITDFTQIYKLIYVDMNLPSFVKAAGSAFSKEKPRQKIKESVNFEKTLDRLLDIAELKLMLLIMTAVFDISKEPKIESNGEQAQDAENESSNTSEELNVKQNELIENFSKNIESSIPGLSIKQKTEIDKLALPGLIALLRNAPQLLFALTGDVLKFARDWYGMGQLKNHFTIRKAIQLSLNKKDKQHLLMYKLFAENPDAMAPPGFNHRFTPLQKSVDETMKIALDVFAKKPTQETIPRFFVRLIKAVEPAVKNVIQMSEKSVESTDAVA